MRIYRSLLVAIGVVMCALTAAPVAAQQTESRIVGRLLDESRSALPGVTVTVTAVDTGTVRTTVTDTDGTFAVTNLSRGAYTVVAELPGFATITRQVALGVGQNEAIEILMSVAGIQEAITVNAEARVLDTTSAKLGVNVSPEELVSLPVNGRNFANLMTLAPGATSDGNGGWASVRFNGKSNQQNYLNYDGVDGTYVWDASPGYLNATGSQFRLQTSMESVAEFRVNSGLAPAESGLGSGGNITVVSKSGSNRFAGSIFEFLRNDAMDAANKYDNIKQPLELNQFGGSLGGPIARNKTFIFFSYEGLKQNTGLTFTEAVPSDEARRRILAGEPVGSGAGQSPARTQAVAPLLSGFPQGTVATSNALVALATRTSQAEQTENSMSLRIDHRFNNSHNAYVRYLFSDGEVDTPDRTVTERRVLAKQRPQNVVGNFQSIRGLMVNEVKVGYNAPQTSATAFGSAGYDPVGVSLSGTFTSSSIDARGNTGIARSGLLIRASSASSTTGSVFDPRSISLQDTVTWTRSAHTFKSGFEYRDIQSDFQFLGSQEITYNSINDFIDNRPNSVAANLDSPLFKPQQFYFLGFMQDSWRVNNKLSLELGMRYDYYSVVKEADGRARPFFVEENAFGTDPNNFYNPDKNNFSPAALSGVAAERPDGGPDRFRPVLRPGAVRGPHPADRELHRAPPRRRGRHPQQRPRLPGTADADRPDAVDSWLHPPPAGRVQRPVRRQRVAGTARCSEPDRRLHRQPGQGHVPPRRIQHTRPRHAQAADSGRRPGGLQDLGLHRRSGDQRQPDQRLRLRQLQRAADQRHPPLPRRVHRRHAVTSSRRTRARRRGRTKRGPPATPSTTRPSTAPTRRTSRTRSTARWST